MNYMRPKCIVLLRETKVVVFFRISQKYHNRALVVLQITILPNIILWLSIFLFRCVVLLLMLFSLCAHICVLVCYCFLMLRFSSNFLCIFHLIFLFVFFFQVYFLTCRIAIEWCPQKIMNFLSFNIKKTSKGSVMASNAITIIFAIANKQNPTR